MIIPDILVTEAEALVHDTVAACVRIGKRKSTGLRRPRRTWKGWFPKVTTNWTLGRSTSRGGVRRYVPFVNIAMRAHLAWDMVLSDAPTFQYKEYASIASEPAIGAFSTPDWRHVIEAITCHEVAHAFAVTMGMPGNFLEMRRRFAKIHGPGWRELYALFRGELLNDRIRESGGKIGPDLNKHCLADLDALPFRLQPLRDPKGGKPHLVLASDDRVRIRPRVIRKEHQALCTGKNLWELDPPVLARGYIIEDGICPACATMAIEALGKGVKKAA